FGDAPKGPSLQRTSAVASYRPNGFGPFDIHGNAWEWWADWNGADSYKQSPRQDPPGPPEGSARVFRAGGWFGHGQDCRAARPVGDVPAGRNSSLGCRVALVLSGG